MRVCHPISRVVVVALAITIGLPSPPATVSAASDTWSRVTGLERDRRIVVLVRDAADAYTVSGRLVAADGFGLTVRANGRDQTVSRDRVAKVTLIRGHRSAPLAIAALAVGLVAGVGVAFLCCSDTSHESGGRVLSSAGRAVVAIIAIPVGIGVGWHPGMRDDSTRVIYERRGPATQVPSDRGEGNRDRAGEKGVYAKSGREFDPAAWETIRPNLPPSLQGRR